MTDRLMTPDELRRVTGKARYGKQADWFKQNFNFDAVRSFDGSLIVTWVLYDALVARRAGLESIGKTVDKRPEICSPFV